MHRRTFLRTSVAASLFGHFGATAAFSEDGQKRGLVSPVESALARICFFLDPIDHFDFTYAEVASMLRQLKVAGPDLTVRPGGLIKPENAAEELPKAYAVFREHGLFVPMLTTNITSASDPNAKKIFSAMKDLKIRFYKLGYYKYSDLAKWEEQLVLTKRELTGLVELGSQFNVVAGFHNHAGGIGGVMWDLSLLLDGLDPRWVGAYFDPAHATVEGSELGWQLGFERLASRTQMIAVKDFIREKVNGVWRTRWCPLGEGMVKWPEFFTMLARTSFTGPISLHIEYDPGGSSRVERMDRILAAAEKDLQFLRQGLRRAYEQKS